MRGVPHCHIVAFLHPEDKLRMDLDRIDQMIWAEIPIDFGSDDFLDYLKNYRNGDQNRNQRFREFHLDPQKHVGEDIKDDGDLNVDQDPKPVQPKPVSNIRIEKSSQPHDSMSELLAFFNIDNPDDSSMSNWIEVNFNFLLIKLLSYLSQMTV